MKVFKINGSNYSLLNDLNGSNQGTVLFYHPQCGHCQSMKPQWEEMKKKINKRNCNIYEVNGENMDEIYHPMKEVVNGFPTIMNVHNGKLTQFEKERNTENMIKFVLANEEKQSSNTNKATRDLIKRKVSFHLNEDDNLIKQRRTLKAKNIINSLKIARKKASMKRRKYKSKKRRGNVKKRKGKTKKR